MVASSNNGAVENVTLELPQRDKIDERWLTELDYFGELGKWITGKPAWGLFSAALGNKTNRKTFVTRFYYGEGEPLGKTAPETDEFDGELDDLEDAPDTTGKADLEQKDGSPPTEGTDKDPKPKGFREWLDNQETAVAALTVS